MDNKMQRDYTNLPQEKFELVQTHEKLHDKELETKPVSYFEDAWIRFRKNKASVVAAMIILVLVIYAIVAPMFSQFTVAFREPIYRKTLPKSQFFSKFGIWDGSYKAVLNQQSYDLYKAQEVETGIPTLKDVYKKRTVITRRGKSKKKTVYYEVRVDNYNATGMVYRNLTNTQFEKLCKWQDQTGIQVLYPIPDPKGQDRSVPRTIAEDPNIWYKIDRKGEAVLDENNNFQPVYKTMNPERYTSLRVESDPGDYAYYTRTQTGNTVRVLYSNYYKYLYSGSKIKATPEVTPEEEFKVGKEPSFLFGTNQYGQDLYTCLAAGARFSFLLAIFISIINLSIGAVIGALEGYYGGTFDILMERFKEVLGGVPFMITVTLFQLHLAKKVGPVVSLLFAFVLTGWIGMASLVRTQFYRFKHQEYVLAARTLGAKDNRIIRKHIFPNAIGTIITSVVLIIPGVIFSESILSYLGIVNLSSSTTTSVGTLLAGGQAYLQDYPHIIFFPALFISLLEISFNLFGNGLRDAFNPSMRGADE